MKTLKISELSKWCTDIVSSFEERQIVLLNGTLGAGKTELVKNFVQVLNAESSSSPTFSLINEYFHDSKKIYHVDLYRIKDAEDLESIGFWDLFEIEKGIIFIEWPDRIGNDLWPRDWNKKYINIVKIEDDSVRNYEISD